MQLHRALFLRNFSIDSRSINSNKQYGGGQNCLIKQCSMNKSQLYLFWQFLILVVSIMKTFTHLGVLAASLTLLYPLASSVLAAPNDAEVTGPRAIKRDFLPDFRAQVKQNPAVAPRLLQEFWQEQQNQTTNLLLTTSIEAARILWHTDRSNPDDAIALLDLTVQRFPRTRSRFLVIEAKAEILRRADRLDEASALLEATWPQVQSRNLDPVMLPILSEWVEVLREQKKPEQAIELLQVALQGAPPLANWMNFYRLMVDAQTDAGHSEEALRWAALFFRVAPFEEDDIARATSAVARGWIQSNQMGNPALFTAAQTAVTAPNPLGKISPPTLPETVKVALQTRVQGDSDKDAAPSRIAILLFVGDYRSAMLEAREILLRDPMSAVGTAEVARVFKAADGDVARANAFLTFYRTGKGENPLIEFLREEAPREVTP